MAALLEVPSLKNSAAFHLRRWKQVCADPALRQLPDRIETNRFGHVVMMPPPGFVHSKWQSLIIRHLHEGGASMPLGVVCGECAVLTSDGVKGLDAAWISQRRLKRSLKEDVLTVAPEICVEVISPSNTRQEIEGKRGLYFAAGAEEVWICDKSGQLHFFFKDRGDKAVKASAICPEMPKQL